VEGCAAQYRGRKKIDPAPLDDFLESAARAELGFAEDDEPPEDETVYLHYHSPQALAWLLQSWQAYRHRGILPYAGGLANQPRVWVKAIGILNARYAPIYARLLHEKYPDSGGGNHKEETDLLAWVQQGGDGGSWTDTIGEHGNQ
jgi:hypothetical protein